MTQAKLQTRLAKLAAVSLMLISANALAVPDSNSIELSNCTLSMPGSTITAAARCGYLEVPENPADQNGRTIRLHVAVGDASSQSPQADPVFFFAGGPGQAASETWPWIRNALRKLRKDRDIIMVDQRGTGQSNKLQCTSDQQWDLNAEIDFEEMARETERCLASLEADPRFYTTTIAMQDIDRVRAAMGYDQINLVGVSYGTRAAQVYLKQFPERVRTVTLDSVVPMQLALGQEHAPMLDRAIAHVLDDCAADTSCESLYARPGDELSALLQQLRDEPQEITIPHPVTGQPETFLLRPETLAVALRFLSYASETQALLPLLIHEAVSSGELERLASQAILVMSNLSEMIARGMEMSVMCSEDYPAMDFSADYSDTILGNVMMEGIRAQCEVWPKGEVPSDFHVAFESQVPVLLLSGERDPVTPPIYAEQAAQAYPNHLNLVADGQSHSVLRLACFQEIATGFIEAGSPEGVDDSCVGNIAPSPFFTSLLGPEP